MGIWKKFAALFLGMALVVPTVSAAGDPQPTVGEVVSAVEATYGHATSIRADFQQVTRSKALGTEERQKGKLSLERPKKVRIDMGQPVQQSFVSDGKTLWVYVAKDKQVTEMPELGDGSAGIGILLEDLSRLSELFDVTIVPEKAPGKPSVTVQLVPRKPGPFKSVQLTLSKQKYVLQDLVLVNQMDDVTEMNFSMVKMNQDIPDAEFTFVPPPGVTVVKAGAM